MTQVLLGFHRSKGNKCWGYSGLWQNLFTNTVPSSLRFSEPAGHPQKNPLTPVHTGKGCRELVMTNHGDGHPLQFPSAPILRNSPKQSCALNALIAPLSDLGLPQVLDP